MKTNYVKTVLTAIFAIAFCVSNAATIHSTATGGNWNETTTWQEGIVPGATDDVIITSNATVIVYDGQECYNLTVESDAILQDLANHTLTLLVHGNMTNNGEVTKANHDFYIYITGNIVNNGEWICSRVYFTGTNPQTVSLAAGKVFDCDDWIDQDSNSAIEALTGLAFLNTDIDLNGSALNMPAGQTLSMNDGSLVDGTFDFNEGTLYMDNNADIGSNTSLIDVTLEGTIQLQGTGIEFTGEIINNAYLSNLSSINVTTINGNLTNNDTITNSNFDMSLNITGNITNNGTWSNSYTYFTGPGSHSIFQGSGKKFSGSHFTAANTTGNITSLTDLTFEGTDFDLNGRTLTMPSTKGSTLSFSGGGLKDGIVDFNEGTLYMDNNADIGSNTSLIDVTLEGTIQLQGTGIEFTGEIINNAYLSNLSSINVTTINGNLTNNDTITNSNFDMSLNITGNITNNGTWSNSYTYFTGPGSHSIFQGSGKKFSGSHFTAANTTGNITSLTDLTFEGTDVDLNGTELFMSDEKRLSVTGTSGNSAHITDGTISGESYEFEGNGYSYLSDMTFSGNVALFGNVRTVAITFQGDVDVRDTLNSRPNISSTVTIEGRIINNGAIINGSTSYHLTLYCKGHLINNGIWANYETRLNGTEDQLIYLVSQKPIEGDVRFDAVTGTSPYQWYHNDTIMDSPDFTGETSQILNWEVPVSDIWKGDFYCVTASDTSRTIVLRSGIIVDPKVFLQGPYNGTDMNTDLADLGYIPLEQPFNHEPWNYTGDEAAPYIPSDIVDWVLVELRQTTGGPETATSDSIVMRRALLLRNDGVAVDPYNFTPELKYDIQVSSNIYLVIWQLNHLGVMSAVPLNNLSPARYDFTTTASQAYGGTDAMIDLGNGVYGMMGGDGDFNQQITEQDKLGFWNPIVGRTMHYKAADYTLDGQIDNQDKNEVWVKTLGKQTQVPE